MPHIAFTSHLQQHIDCKQQWVDGSTVRLALEQVFLRNPRLRGYLCDDQGRLRKHVTVFVDGQTIRDRDCLSDPVAASTEILVMQALSGG